LTWSLDGHLLVAKQLQQLILTTFENIQTTWTTDASFTALQHQLNSITDRILGIGGNNQPESSVSASNKPQTTTEQQQKWAPSSAVEESDQFQNYAPKCTITSSSPVAQHMPVLLSANASQRRSRTPQWTYNFLPGQEWLDISLTLPHPVMLKEIVVKPHLSALIGCPSAVQAEVQADPLGLHWSAIQCPQHTLGRSVVRISAAHYKNPIKSVNTQDINNFKFVNNEF
jgi:hypothetical protein